jgi:hypothetical protein
VAVVAADLWVDPTDNQRRGREAGVEDRVLPVRLEAHDLPFSDDTFTPSTAWTRITISGRTGFSRVVARKRTVDTEPERRPG